MSIFLSRKYANNAGDFSRETPISRPLQNCGKRHWYGVDTEARWVKKAGKCHFGYKRHTVVNQDGLVIAEETTPANESDIKHLVTPLEKAGLEQGTPVMADKGYDSSENRTALSSMRLKGCIMHKAQKNRSLTERERPVNKAVSKVRYAVERTYGSMHRWFGPGWQDMWGWPRRTRSTSWRLSPTTCTERRGLLCPIASDKGETGVREALENHIFHGFMPFKALL